MLDLLAIDAALPSGALADMPLHEKVYMSFSTTRELEAFGNKRLV